MQKQNQHMNDFMETKAIYSSQDQKICFREDLR
jgi:hypothetical protein